jgi:hypothetical protein
MRAMNAAVAYARSLGATIVEGYPVEPGKIYTYMGSPETFRKAGFEDVTPAGQERRVVRTSTVHCEDGCSFV